MLETIRTVARSLGVHHTLGLTYEPTVPHHPPAVVAPDVGAGGGVSPGHSALPTDVEREDNHYYSQSSLTSPLLTWHSGGTRLSCPAEVDILQFSPS